MAGQSLPDNFTRATVKEKCHDPVRYLIIGCNEYECQTNHEVA